MRDEEDGETPGSADASASPHFRVVFIPHPSSLTGDESSSQAKQILVTNFINGPPGLSWTPDGSMMLYGGSEGPVITRIDGVAPIKPIKDVGPSCQWSPVGRSLMFLGSLITFRICGNDL